MRVIATLSSTARDAGLAQLVRESTEVPARFPGCRSFQVFLDPGDDRRFLLYEEWDDQASFDAYRTSDYFQAAGAVLFPALDGRPDSAYYASERVGP